MHRSRAHVATPPNVITRRAPVPESEKPTIPHWETFDTEMDDPALRDPRMAAQMRDLEGRVLTTSHSAHVEQMMMAYEENYASSRQHQWHGQQRWMGRENEEMRMVRIYHPYQFIRLLNKGGIRAEIKNEYQDRFSARAVRVWLNPFMAKAKFRNVETNEVREVPSGLIGVNTWMADDYTGAMEVRTITTLQYPYGPEWSVMRFNDYNVPTREKYKGWRTALLTMIVAGVLSEAEAHKCFGEPRGMASLFYREQLYNHRNHKTALNKY